MSSSEDTTMGEGQWGPNIAELFGNLSAQLTALREEQANEREAIRVQIRTLEERFTTPGSTPVNVMPQPTEAPPTAPPTTPPTASPTQEPTPPPQKKKKATLPDPPRFDGVRKRFPGWLIEMKNKLQTDGEAIGSNRD